MDTQLYVNPPALSFPSRMSGGERLIPPLQEQQLDDQLDVLNAAYAPHGISFNLLGRDWTINADWADDSDELAYKQELRQGDYSTLNVYFLRQPNFQALGYCYFPDNFEEGSDDFYLDGCVIDAASVPGGSAAPYNLGGTVPHEVWTYLVNGFISQTYEENTNKSLSRSAIG